MVVAVAVDVAVAIGEAAAADVVLTLGVPTCHPAIQQATSLSVQWSGAICIRHAFACCDLSADV